MKRMLLLGNEAIARGAWEAGARVVSSYPGTPSTEVTEYAARYPELYAEWATNEKVALEVCVGASLGGARAMCCMKHVGLNVAADPLYTVSYTGVNGGLVLVVADDPGMHSSQNEQDSRFHARASGVPMLEPSDSAECLGFTKAAFELSERFDTPVIVRTTTRVAHARSLTEVHDREIVPPKPYHKDPAKYVMMPAMARGRHVALETRMADFAAHAEGSPLNRMEMRDLDIGVICSGITYEYVREALPEASVLKLGIVNPLPEKLIRSFASRVGALYVLEELEPVIEEQVRAMGIPARGVELTGRQGELSVNRIRRIFELPLPESVPSPLPTPQRPPVLCAGCPHRGPFMVLNKLGMRVMGDIGCYTLGALAPLSALDATLCMGASVGMAQGLALADAGARRASGNTVAVIGDSTFLHSGVPSLLSAAYNRHPITLLILDNRTTGMTGHQPNPVSGRDIYGNETTAVDLEALCRACGVGRVRTVDAYDLAALEAALKEEAAADEPSVVVVRRPCALLDKAGRRAPLTVDRDQCRRCMACVKTGCPAIERRGDEVFISAEQCAGCGLCLSACRFSAIRKAGDAE